VGPELAYEVGSALWEWPRVIHGPRAGLRMHVLPQPFRRRGFEGSPESLSFAVQITMGLVAIEAAMPRTPTMGVALIFESF